MSIGSGIMNALTNGMLLELNAFHPGKTSNGLGLKTFNHHDRF